MDDELEHAGLDHGVTWSLAGEEVCSVFARDGRLEGLVAPSTVPDDIGSDDRIESFHRHVREAAKAKPVPASGALPVGLNASVQPAIGL